MDIILLSNLQPELSLQYFRPNCFLCTDWLKILLNLCFNLSLTQSNLSHVTFAILRFPYLAKLDCDCQNLICTRHRITKKMVQINLVSSHHLIFSPGILSSLSTHIWFFQHFPILIPFVWY